MKSKKLKTFFLILISYFILLILLVAAESASPDASITSLPLAIWYSLVTMTTVGYGDLFPVSVAGKLIGILFLLLSAGALTALISIGVSWLTGSGIPKYKLKKLKNKKIYIFDSCDDASVCLSENIHSNDNNAVSIFSSDSTRTDTGNTLYLSLPVLEILRNLNCNENNCTVIFTSDDALERYSHCEIPDGIKVVCKTLIIPEQLTQSLQFYDRSELCASFYWQKNPLLLDEKCVVIIGFENLGRKILEYALENCILSPVRVVNYHVFGDASQFISDHPYLSPSVSINEKSSSTDSLFIHDESWNSSCKLLQTADRIIFCSDDENINLSNYQRLKTYFPTDAKLFLYNTGILNSEIRSFGSDSEIYTSEAVLHAGLEQTGRLMHEIYSSGSGNTDIPSWDNLPAFTRRSNYASAQHIYEKVRYLLNDSSITVLSKSILKNAYAKYSELKKDGNDIFRKIEHERWVRFHLMYNWCYSPNRNNSHREHPLLIPYESLTPEDQAKDDYAWEFIDVLANYID